MRPEVAIEPVARYWRRRTTALLQLGKVIRWCNTTDYSIRPVRQRGLIYNRIINSRPYLMALAPLLREYVMNIDILTKNTVWSNC